MAEVGEEEFELGEASGAGELVDEGVVGAVGVGEAGVEVAGVVEDADGEIEVVLPADHGDEALRVEAVGPGMDGRGDAVGLEELLLGGGRGEEVADVDGGGGVGREVREVHDGG